MRPSRLSRFAVAIAAVLAILAGNTLVAMPAAAAPQSLFLSVTDNGVPQVGSVLTAVRTSDNATFTETTDATGVAIFSLDPGTYDVATQDDGVYRVQTRSFTIASGFTTHSGMVLTKRGVVTGTIPVDAVGHTSLTVLVMSWGGTPMPGDVTWTGNSYRYVFDDSGSNALDYYVSVFFDVDDTVPYRDTYLGGGATAPAAWSSPGVRYMHVDTGVDVGASGLVGASFVSGSVSGAFGPIAGATVRASADAFATSYTATTDADGDFTIVLPAGDATYAVTASKLAYASGSGAPFSVNAANNWRASAGSITLETALATVYGDVVDQTGHDYPVSALLYTADSVTGLFDANATNIGTTSDFSSAAIGPGTYRLAFWDDSSSSFIPWTSYEASNAVSGVTMTGPVGVESERQGGDCYIEFVVADNVGDTVLDDVAVDPSVPSWQCHGGFGGTFSGSVDNHAAGMGDLTAELARVDYPYSTIDSVPVRADGSFVLQGVTEDTDYFVTIRTEEDVEWFDTFLGDVHAASLGNLSGVTAVALTAGSNSTGNDVTLLPATVFTGTVSSGGVPLASQCVVAIDELDPSITWCDTTNSAGVFHIKTPVGGNYTLEASGYGYDAKGYADPLDPSELMVWSSTPQTTYNGLDFDLTPWPPSIYGYVYSDSLHGSTTDDVTVHLFAKGGSGWGEVGTFAPDPGNDGYFAFDADDIYPSGDGLPAGDYRLRFESADGSWLAISEHTDLGATLTLSPDGCFIDLTAVEAGPPREVLVAVNEASTVSCAAEPTAAVGDVTGTLVESAALGGSAIADQTVVLENASGAVVATAVTDSLGRYTLDDVPAGRYSLSAPMRAHVAGQHSYVSKTVDDILVAGGAQVAPVDLVRYGNVVGTVQHWVPTSTPTTVVAMRYDTVSDEWVEASGIEVAIAADGTFEVPGIDVDDDYSLYFDVPDDSPFVDAFYLGTPSDTLGNEFQGSAEQDYPLGPIELEAAEYISGTVKSASGSPIAGAVVTAQSFVFYDEYTAISAADGTYSIKVQGETSVLPFNVYEVGARAAGYIDQWYLNSNGACGCGTLPVFVGSIVPPATDIDFSMFTTGTIVLEMYDEYFDDAASSYEPYDGVATHVYKKVTGGWQEVTSATSSPDGFAVAGLSAAGDYRVRFSDGTNWLKVIEYERDGGGYVAAPGDRCSIDLGSLVRGDHVDLAFELEEDTPVGDCAAEPAIVPTTTPGKGGGGSSTPRTTGSVSEPVPSASPTPSSVPSAEPTSEPDAEPTAQPTPDPEETASTPDLSWFWILIAIILALVVAGVAFVILRRRV